MVLIRIRGSDAQAIVRTGHKKFSHEAAQLSVACQNVSGSFCVCNIILLHLWKLIELHLYAENLNQRNIEI